MMDLDTYTYTIKVNFSPLSLASLSFLPFIFLLAPSQAISFYALLLKLPPHIICNMKVCLLDQE